MTPIEKKILNKVYEYDLPQDLYKLREIIKPYLNSTNI